MQILVPILIVSLGALIIYWPQILAWATNNFFKPKTPVVKISDYESDDIVKFYKSSWDLLVKIICCSDKATLNELYWNIDQLFDDFNGLVPRSKLDEHTERLYGFHDDQMAKFVTDKKFVGNQ